MKVLAVSLLRIGDLLMHMEALRAYLHENPSAEIHLLLNDSSMSLRSILGESVQKVIVFPRKELQEILVEQNRSLWAAFRQTQALVTQLNNEKYDVVLNLTHNLLSARLIDLIQAPIKKGAYFVNGKARPADCQWGVYFNDIHSGAHQAPFHYLDGLARSLDIGLTMNQNGQARGSRYICLQVLTSDAKKNWSMNKFSQLAAELKEFYPEYTFVVLAAPFEKDIVQSKDFPAGVEVRYATWVELVKILQDTRLLITGDTSVQHLAAQMNVQMLSLFMGSANVTKTGPRSVQSYVVTPSVSCYPCSHHQSCPQSTLKCENQIQVHDVVSLAKAMLNDQAYLPQNQNLHYYQVQNRNNFYFIQGLGEEKMTTLEREIKQITWQFYLDHEYENPIPPYGTAIRTIMQNTDLDEISDASMNLKIEQFETALMWLESLDEAAQKSVRLCFRENNDQISEIQRKILETYKQFTTANRIDHEYIQVIHNALTEQHKTAFGFIRKLKSSIKEGMQLIQIDLKITKDLLNAKKERGSYVSRARELS
ncbi:MAG: hypothetical protein BroJett040_05350 [Oligoflexia bacterium]|nr:MAG: hypothetical protein BroJett040_05350 [Oligoflexia bacterium]